MSKQRSRIPALAVGVASLLTIVVFSAVSPETAMAAVSVSRAEVDGTRLRIEGTAAASRAITVDGVQMAVSSGSGSFKIDRSGYVRPADCTVDISDGTAPAINKRLSGCTSTVPTTTTAPAPTTTTTTTPASTTTTTPTTTTTTPTTPTSPPATSVTIDSVTVTTPSVQGGATVGGTSILSAVAPPGGAIVGLSSSNPALVTVPATMTVPAGVNSWPFFISTVQVSTTTSAVISATYNGVTRSVTLTLTPPPPQPTAFIDSVILDPAIVQTGTASTTVTVLFTALTPVGGALVTLSSSNTALATVPASVLVPAFSSQGALSASIKPGVSGTVTISATYNGVTRSAVLTISAQSLLRFITQSPLPNATVGANYAGFIEACCGQGTPYTWSLVSGSVPSGLRFAGNDLRLTRTTAVTGVATRVQTSTFTVRVRDTQGNTATKTFTLTVDPASPLIINNGTDVLTNGRVGVAYNNGLFPLGGTPPWTWSHVAGTLPPGLSVQASPGRVLGTPTTAGTFTFTVRVNDSAGQSATGQFTITIAP
jgi:hypothetical protein